MVIITVRGIAFEGSGGPNLVSYEDHANLSRRYEATKLGMKSFDSFRSPMSVGQLCSYGAFSDYQTARYIRRDFLIARFLQSNSRAIINIAKVLRTRCLKAC